MQKDINAPISALKFSNDLKEADIIPACEKKNLSYLKKTGHKKTIGE